MPGVGGRPGPDAHAVHPSPAQGRCRVAESPSSSEPNGPPSFSGRCSQVFGRDTAPLVGQTEAGSWPPVVSPAWNRGHEDLWGRGSEEGKRLLAPTEPQEAAAPSPGCPAELSSEGEFAPDPGEPWPHSPPRTFSSPTRRPLATATPHVCDVCPGFSKRVGHRGRVFVFPLLFLTSYFKIVISSWGSRKASREGSCAPGPSRCLRPAICVWSHSREVDPVPCCRQPPPRSSHRAVARPPPPSPHCSREPPPSVPRLTWATPASREAARSCLDPLSLRPVLSQEFPSPCPDGEWLAVTQKLSRHSSLLTCLVSLSPFCSLHVLVLYLSSAKPHKTRAPCSFGRSLPWHSKKVT